MHRSPKIQNGKINKSKIPFIYPCILINLGIIVSGLNIVHYLHFANNIGTSGCIADRDIGLEFPATIKSLPSFSHLLISFYRYVGQKVDQQAT